MRRGILGLIVVVRRIIMENYKSKNEKIKTIIFFVLLIIATIGVILAMILQKCNIFAGYIIAPLCGSIIISVTLIFLIKHSIKSDKNERPSRCKNISKIIIAIVINLLFVISSTVFIVQYNENLKDPFILISSQIALILLLIIVNIFINIENGDDISLLKATNYFLVYLFTAMRLLGIGESFLIDYYYLLPLIIVQGLYELLDGKSKRKKVTQG
jgi:protein-S-isoprenylcysteine O-methyltransferase Ste14